MRTPVRRLSRFDRYCNSLALLWLLCVGMLSFGFRNSSHDFGQYYMGGVIAADRQWDSLYPVPIAGSHENPGNFDASMMRPEYARLADARAVGNVNRFFQPPVVALMMIPLASLRYRQAQLIWLLLMTLCGWLVSMQSATFYRRCVGRGARGAGWITLLVATSPLMFRTLRTFQVTPAVAMLLGVALLDWPIRRRRARFALAFVWTIFLKYAALALLPMFIIYRKRGHVGSVLIVGMLLTGLGMLWCGFGPFMEYLSHIAPLLDRSSGWRGNQSIEGVLIRLSHRDPLPTSLVVALRIAMLVCGGVIVALFSRLHTRRFPVRAAAAALCICWLLLFSPLFWEHYALYLCPLWGWMIAETRFGGVRRWLAIGGLGLNWCPLAVTAWFAHGGLLISHMTAGTIMIAALATYRLISPYHRLIGDRLTG